MPPKRPQKGFLLVLKKAYCRRECSLYIFPIINVWNTNIDQSDFSNMSGKGSTSLVNHVNVLSQFQNNTMSENHHTAAAHTSHAQRDLL